MGSRPVAWPLSLATKRCRMPKNTYSGSHPATFAQGLPKKTSFPWDTHLPSRVPTWSLYNTHGGRAPSLGPCLWQRSAAGCPKNTYSGSHPATFAQGLPKKRVFPGTLGESGRVGPRIGVFGHPAALRCQRQGPSDGARPHGCCRGTMWVPCWVGGYPGKTRFLGRLWVQVLGGGVL